MAVTKGPKKSNPPIKGHELINEGHIHLSYGLDQKVVGGCRCGLVPEGWRDMSINDVKRWHKEHKAEVRAKMEVGA